MTLAASSSRGELSGVKSGREGLAEIVKVSQKG